MIRFLLAATVGFCASCQQCANLPQPRPHVSDRSAVHPSDVASILKLLPPPEPRHTRSVTKVDAVTVSLHPGYLKPGDVLVTDADAIGGATIWAFRKQDGQWTKVICWGEIP